MIAAHLQGRHFFWCSISVRLGFNAPCSSLPDAGLLAVTACDDCRVENPQPSVFSPLGLCKPEVNLESIDQATM
jgi:hypothetical protein